MKQKKTKNTDLLWIKVTSCCQWWSDTVCIFQIWNTNDLRAAINMSCVVKEVLCLDRKHKARCHLPLYGYKSKRPYGKRSEFLSHQWLFSQSFVIYHKGSRLQFLVDRRVGGNIHKQEQELPWKTAILLVKHSIGPEVFIGPKRPLKLNSSVAGSLLELGTCSFAPKTLYCINKSKQYV